MLLFCHLLGDLVNICTRRSAANLPVGASSPSVNWNRPASLCARVCTAVVFWKRVREKFEAHDGKARFSKGDGGINPMFFYGTTTGRQSENLRASHTIFENISIADAGNSFSYFKWKFYNYKIYDFTILMCIRMKKFWRVLYFFCLLNCCYLVVDFCQWLMRKHDLFYIHDFCVFANIK